MSFLEQIDLNGYEVLTALIFANITAQIAKTFFHFLTHREFDFSILTTTGGMPSSHSASVCAMATTVGLVEGFDSTLFAISLSFAIVVMYDAAGVRRAAGRQARALNSIVRELMAPDHQLNEDKLKEFLGHTPKEVIAGATWGVLISFGLRHLIESSYAF